MKRATLETIVGIFVLIGIACLTYLSIKLGKLELVGGRHYMVTGVFDSVAGLKSGATVEIAGVEVGRVDRISLDGSNDRALVKLQIREGIKLTDDVIASIRTRGIIGDKYIVLTPGGSERFLGNNGKIRDTESAVDFEQLLSKYIHGQVQ